VTCQSLVGKKMIESDSKNSHMLSNNSFLGFRSCSIKIQIEKNPFKSTIQINKYCKNSVLHKHQLRDKYHFYTKTKSGATLECSNLKEKKHQFQAVRHHKLDPNYI